MAPVVGDKVALGHAHIMLQMRLGRKGTGKGVKGTHNKPNNKETIRVDRIGKVIAQGGRVIHSKETTSIDRVAHTTTTTVERWPV